MGTGSWCCCSGCKIRGQVFVYVRTEVLSKSNWRSDETEKKNGASCKSNSGFNDHGGVGEKEKEARLECHDYKLLSCTFLHLFRS